MAIQHQSRFASFQHGTVAPSPLFNRIDEPMRETSTGIANPAVIDLFGVDQKTGEVLLVMNEPQAVGRRSRAIARNAGKIQCLRVIYSRR
jgi:hypothetical protein